MTTTHADGKASFDHIYNRPDPRSYFHALGALDYQVPQHAHAVFAAVLRARAADAPDEPGGVLDVCCSYGINAALLRCELTLAELYARYEDPELAALSTHDLAAADREFFAQRRRSDPPVVHGLDVADKAVEYGRAVGLLDAAWAEDLESGEPSAELADGLGDVGLVTVTGGVGYVTERTFDRVLGAFPPGRVPWVAAFVLRTYAYDGIAETLRRHDLVTEHLADTTFRQRRFASPEEQSATIQAVSARGVDVAGKEEDGWMHCEFYLSRPTADARRRPLDDVVAA